MRVFRVQIFLFALWFSSFGVSFTIPGRRVQRKSWCKALCHPQNNAKSQTFKICERACNSPQGFEECNTSYLSEQGLVRVSDLSVTFSGHSATVHWNATTNKTDWNNSPDIGTGYYVLWVDQKNNTEFKFHCKEIRKDQSLQTVITAQDKWIRKDNYLKVCVTSASNPSTDRTIKCVQPELPVGQPENKEPPTKQAIYQGCSVIKANGPFIGLVETVNVSFSANSATLTWSPLNLANKEANWTGYAVLWWERGRDETDANYTCSTILKGDPRRLVVESRRKWTLSSLIVCITTIPIPSTRHLSRCLQRFHPPKIHMQSSSVPPSLNQQTLQKTGMSCGEAAIVVGIVTGMLLFLVIAIFLLHKKKGRKWLSFHSNLDLEATSQDYAHDVFVSFCQSESQFVVKTLLPLLRQNSISYCYEDKDYQPGITRDSNILNCLYSSRKVLCVVSSNYLASSNCCRELEQFLYHCSYKIFVVRIGSTTCLPKTLANRTYIDYSDKFLEARTWQLRVLKCLKAPSKDSTSSISQGLQEKDRMLDIHEQTV